MVDLNAATHGFMPHGHCYLWRPDLLWLHVGSDALITLAYYSIPLSILIFARRRPELEFRSLYWLFGLFIFLCGTTHLFGIVTTYKPYYLAAGLLKALTATASVATAIVIWNLLPRALAIPSAEKLNDLNNELAELNTNLEKRVQEKTAELIDADKAKDQFLAMVSHELRSPLAVVIGYFELLEMSGDDPEEREFALRNIRTSLRKQQGLLNNLLDVSRIISGNFPFDKDHTDLEKIIHETIDSLLIKADHKKITLTRNIAHDIGYAYCDGLRISQVLTNLIENSIKFSPEKTTVAIKAFLDKDRNIVISVRDEGLGIPPEQIPYVFDRYWRSNAIQSNIVGGLGLGLAISKHIVDGHGGYLTVSSNGKHQGTEFQLTLPATNTTSAVDSVEQNQKTSMIPKSTYLRGGSRVLILDDNEDVLHILQRITTKLGMKPITATNVKDALELLSTHEVDIILSDISMPTTDGLDFIEAVRRFEKYKKCKRRIAIAISAHVSEKQRLTALEAGFDAFLEKPLEASKLLESISQLLD